VAIEGLPKAQKREPVVGTGELTGALAGPALILCVCVLVVSNGVAVGCMARFVQCSGLLRGKRAQKTILVKSSVPTIFNNLGEFLNFIEFLQIKNH
jgi:hypothetical protein